MISRIFRVALVLAAVMLAVTPSECRANTSDFTAKVLTVKEGLTQNGITDIFRDSRGFVWIGTRYGLNRYDTHSIKKYFAEDDENALSGNSVFKIFEDREGYVWVLAASSASIYDPKKGTFREMTVEGYPISARSARLTDDGVLLGGNGMLMSYSYATDSVSVIPVEGGSHEDYVKILPWKDNTYLIHARRDGLWVYDPAKCTIKRCEEIPIRNITSVELDSKGNIWIAPYAKGVECYDPDGNLLKEITMDDGLSSTLIIDLHISGNELMIGSEHGLDIVNLTTGTVDHCARSAYVKRFGSVNKIFVDRWGNLFLGTVRNGVLIIQGTTMHTFPLVPSGEVDNTVTSFLPGLGNKLICGLDGYGLVLFDQNTTEATPVPGTRGMKVISLAQWPGNKVLFADWGSPLKMYNEVTNRIEPIPSFLKPISDYAMVNRLGVNLLNLPDGKLAAVTDGVTIIDPATSGTVTLDEVPKRTSGNMKPFYSDAKRIFAMRDKRLMEADLEKGTVTQLFESPDGSTIECGAFDGNDKLYIATLESLYSYSLSKRTYKCVPSERLRNIRMLYFHDDNLWIGANSQLFRFDRDRMISFDEGNGVTPSDLRPWAIYEDPTHIFFGGTSGMIRVNKANTDSLIHLPTSPGVLHLADIYVNGAPAMQDMKDNVITIPAVHATVRIQIMATEHSPLRFKRYRFNFNGGEYPGAMETTSPGITVSDLPSGATVKVTASYTLSDGSWSEPQYLLTIKVKQLWWRSWWFITIAVIVACVMLFLGFRVMRQRWKADSDRQRRHMLERDVEILANINQSLRSPIEKIADPISRSLKALDSGEPVDPEVIREHLNEALEQVDMMHEMVDSPFEILHSQNLNLTSMNLTARFNTWLADQLDAFVRAHRIDHRIDIAFIPDCDRGTITFNASRLEIVINSLLAVLVEEGHRHLVVGIKDDIESNLYISFTYEGGKLPELDTMPAESENLQLVYARWIAELDNDRVITLIGDDGKLQGAIFVVPAVKSQRTLTLDETHRVEVDGIVREYVTTSNDFSDRTLFILESDGGTADFLRSCTEGVFRSVTVMGETEEAIRHVEEYMPDIVILDSDENLDGSLEICRLIKSSEDLATIPVIMLTAGDLRKIKEASFRYGADAYLEKPFDRSVLVDLCHTLILSSRHD